MPVRCGFSRARWDGPWGTRDVNGTTVRSCWLAKVAAMPAKSKLLGALALSAVAMRGPWGCGGGLSPAGGLLFLACRSQNKNTQLSRLGDAVSPRLTPLPGGGSCLSTFGVQRKEMMEETDVLQLPIRPQTPACPPGPLTQHVITERVQPAQHSAQQLGGGEALALRIPQNTGGLATGEMISLESQLKEG